MEVTIVATQKDKMIHKNRHLFLAAHAREWFIAFFAIVFILFIYCTITLLNPQNFNSECTSNIESSPVCLTQHITQNNAKLVLIAILAGFCGGIGNYLRHRQAQLEEGSELPLKVKTANLGEEMYEEIYQAHYKIEAFSFISLGIIASLMVPLFLHMIGSDIVKPPDDAKSVQVFNGSILVFTGFCLVASLSSKRFISEVAEKALAKAKQTDKDLDKLKEQLDNRNQEFEIYQREIAYANSYANNCRADLYEYGNLKSSYDELKGSLNDGNRMEIEKRLSSQKDKMKKVLTNAINNANQSLEHKHTARAAGLLANAYRRFADCLDDGTARNKYIALAIKSCKSVFKLPEDSEAYESCLYNAVCYLALLNEKFEEIQDTIDRIVSLNNKSVAKDLLMGLLEDDDIGFHHQKDEILNRLQSALNKVEQHG